VLLLALDTCDPQGSVAVLRNDQALQTVAHDDSEDYSSWLLPAVQRVLRAAGVVMTDLDAYAVAVGPGSFTGVRVGLTTVKAWAEVYARSIASVSRLEALAAQASGTEPYIAAFADARRGQVFGALFRRGPVLQRIGEEMVIAPEKFLAWTAEISIIDEIHWISMAPMCLTATEAWHARRSTREIVSTASPLLAPMIGRLGYRLAVQNRLTDALALDANYVRRSDAEIFWNARR
jgi:tRNA threonylcarbamoyladenosine biosynthesis protein TsaB